LLRAIVATTSSETQGVILDITGNETLQQTTVTNSIIDVSSNIGGRKKGATKERKEEATQNHKEVTKMCYLTRRSSQRCTNKRFG
jgi:hypothetical protein